MAYSNEDIFEGARAIRPYLKVLLGAEAERVEDELAKYLDMNREGRRAGDLITDLMTRHENTQLWMRAYLDVGLQLEATRSFSDLPGLPQRVPPAV